MTDDAFDDEAEACLVERLGIGVVCVVDGADGAIEGDDEGGALDVDEAAGVEFSSSAVSFNVVSSRRARGQPAWRRQALSRGPT